MTAHTAKLLRCNAEMNRIQKAPPDNFYQILLKSINQPVRVYIDGGDQRGFAGYVLQVNEDNISFLSIGEEPYYRAATRIITVVPIHKLTALSYYTNGNNCFVDCKELKAIESVNFPCNTPPLDINVLLVALVVLIICC